MGWLFLWGFIMGVLIGMPVGCWLYSEFDWNERWKNDPRETSDED